MCVDADEMFYLTVSGLNFAGKLQCFSFPSCVWDSRSLLLLCTRLKYEQEDNSILPAARLPYLMFSEACSNNRAKFLKSCLFLETNCVS